MYIAFVIIALDYYAQFNTSAKVKKFLRLLKKFGTSKVTKPAQLAQSCSEYDFVNKSTPTLLRVSIE
jgi:hypothetical protein